ncbi:MAG TPA: DUF3248 domain-containing protein [Deinococcales bacterium]|nr:DUF3248 domain-containing protein [Deinococcales bacterium]
MSEPADDPMATTDTAGPDATPGTAAPDSALPGEAPGDLDGTASEAPGAPAGNEAGGTGPGDASDEDLDDEGEDDLQGDGEDEDDLEDGDLDDEATFEDAAGNLSDVEEAELTEAEAAEEELDAILEAGRAAEPAVPAFVPAETLEQLGGNLVWKIGKDEFSEAIIVRVGYAKATRSFKALPRLRSATDQEVADAAKRGDLVIEWIE